MSLFHPSLPDLTWLQTVRCPRCGSHHIISDWHLCLPADRPPPADYVPGTQRRTVDPPTYVPPTLADLAIILKGGGGNTFSRQARGLPPLPWWKFWRWS